MSSAHHVLTVTADDIGLTRANTDTILETVTRGPVTRVSILANGEALTYAAERCAATAEAVHVALHANLTVGAPCAPTERVKELLTDSGVFKYSPLGLWVAYLTASTSQKRALEEQVACELQAQLVRVRTALEKEGGVLVEANGHQHVHMIPFVFDALIALPGINHVRITREPLFVSPRSWRAYLRPQLIGVFVLSALAKRNARRARSAGILTNEYFVGLLCSGMMTQESVTAGLAAVAEHATSSTHAEILFHPGSACANEFFPWTHSALEHGWHFSPWRARERELILSSELLQTLRAFQEGRLTYTWNTLIRVIRFVVSGTTSAGVAIALLYAFTEWGGLWYMTSAGLALACSLLVSFVLQKYWTFSGHERTGTIREVSLFLLMNTVNLGLNALGLFLLVEYGHIWYIAAEFISALVVAVLTFGFMRLVIFPVTHRQ